MRYAAAGLLIGLAGCSSVTKPVTVKEAMDNIERNLIDAKAISVSATTLSNPMESAAFDTAVITAQCSQGHADPDVPLLQDSVDLRLTGSFTAGANLSVDGIGGAPLGGLTGSIDRAKGQELDVPVTFVVLSELPDVILAHRLAPLEKVPEADPTKTDRRGTLTLAHDQLQARVDMLIAGYTAAACTAAQKAGTGTMVMMKVNQH